MTVAVEKPARPDLEAFQKLVSIDEFLEGYPENSAVRYELRRGVIIEMPQPRGKHSEVAAFSRDEFIFEIRLGNLPYFIPTDIVIKRSNDTGYVPDVVVLDRAGLIDEPRWETRSTIENGTSIKLVIEVVSTNWQDDYETKMADYEAIGIPEYWILDYAGLGGVRHIGRPKQPTLTICTFVDGEYLPRQFRDDEAIVSPTFPKLNLTAAQVLNAGR